MYCVCVVCECGVCSVCIVCVVCECGVCSVCIVCVWCVSVVCICMYVQVQMYACKEAEKVRIVIQVVCTCNFHLGGGGSCMLTRLNQGVGLTAVFRIHTLVAILHHPIRAVASSHAHTRAIGVSIIGAGWGAGTATFMVDHPRGATK